MPRYLLLSLALALPACQDLSQLPSSIDNLAFLAFGKTLYQKTESYDLRRLHADNTALLGQEVVVEGELVEVSDHFTYLTLTDQTANMVVVLTEIPDARERLGNETKTMRVLGRVESGEGDQPYILARQVKLLAQPSADRG